MKIHEILMDEGTQTNENWNVTCREAEVPLEMSMWYDRMAGVAIRKGTAKWVEQQVQSFLPPRGVQTASPGLAISRLAGGCACVTVVLSIVSTAIN